MIFIALLYISAETEASGPYFKMVTDSVYNYSYSQDDDSYNLASINYYYYRDGDLDSIISTSADKVPVAKTEYYRTDGLLTLLRTYVARDGAWVPNQNQVLYYDDQSRLIRNVVTVWRNDQWENLNIFTHYYDDNNNLIVFHRDFWMNNMWTDFATDSLFYNSDGYLIERSGRLTSTGKYLTRLLFDYNSSGLRYSQTRQNYLNSTWENVARTYNVYNECGTQVSSFGEKWSDGSWAPDTKSEIFYHYKPMPMARRVPICYNGATIFVHVRDLDSYLDDGACLGRCAGPDEENTSEVPSGPDIRNRRVPFVVYPNPAGEYVNIKSTDPLCPVTRVELIDYYGRAVRSLSTEGKELVTIDLSSLISGNYILRVISDTVYNTLILRR